MCTSFTLPEGHCHMSLMFIQYFKENRNSLRDFMEDRRDVYEQLASALAACRPQSEVTITCSGTPPSGEYQRSAKILDSLSTKLLAIGGVDEALRIKRQIGAIKEIGNASKILKYREGSTPATGRLSQLFKTTLKLIPDNASNKVYRRSNLLQLYKASGGATPKREDIDYCAVLIMNKDTELNRMHGPDGLKESARKRVYNWRELGKKYNRIVENFGSDGILLLLPETICDESIRRLKVAELETFLRKAEEDHPQMKAWARGLGRWMELLRGPPTTKELPLSWIEVMAEDQIRNALPTMEKLLSVARCTKSLFEYLNAEKAPAPASPEACA